MKTIQKKVCLLGDFAVGKTSLIQRFVHRRFSEKYLSTIGVQISRKTLTRSNYVLNFILWDLAGGDYYLPSPSSYLRGLNGAILVCDLTRLQSLDILEEYAAQVRQENPKAAIVLVGNKVDLTKERVISDTSLAQLSAKFAAPYRLTSAKTGQQVDETFNLLANFLSL